MTQPVFALDIRDISHAYGDVRAVGNASLHVDAGEVICLLGPSGCGKSTILRVAAGLETLQRGRVLMDGVLVADGSGAANVPPEHRGVGLVFQDFALFPHLTVAGNLAFGLGDLAPQARMVRVAEVLAQVDMNDYAHAYPHALSGGQQQRVALARALAPKPKVLLLDEPFSGLDARLREQIREETLHVLKRSGTATLMVTHDPEEAMFMADRIYLMDSGRIVQSGSPDMLYRRPVNAFVARFFTALNEWSGEVRDGYVLSPFGRMPVAGYGDGTILQLLVRPESIQVVQPGERIGAGQVVTGRLVEARFLGGIRQLSVSVADAAGGEYDIRIRHAGRFLPEIGGQILLHLDPPEALIFVEAEEGSALHHRVSDKSPVLSDG